MNREDKTLEEISDENMIDFYKVELERIGKGEKAGDLLPGSMVKKFREMGVLQKRYRVHA